MHNTAGDTLGGHALCPLGPQPEQEGNADELCHDPATLFEALPEHSTPATPVAPLFSVGLEFQDDLEQGIISEGFRQAFEEHGISLSENVTITTEVEDSKWRINDTDENRTFIVIRADETLNIYPAGAY